MRVTRTWCSAVRCADACHSDSCEGTVRRKRVLSKSSPMSSGSAALAMGLESVLEENNVICSQESDSCGEGCADLVNIKLTIKSTPSLGPKR